MGNLRVICQSIVAIPIVYYGFSLHKASISLHIIPVMAIPGGLTFYVMGPPSILFSAVLMICVKKMGSSRLRKLLLPFGLACLTVSNVMVAVAYYGGVHNETFLCASTVFHAWGALAISALWIDLYARLNPIRAVFCNAASVILAQVLIFFTEQSSMLRIFILLFCLLFVSGACYILTAKRDGEGSEASRPVFSDMRESYPFPYKATFLIAACSFAYGMANTAISGEGTRYTSLLPSLIVVAMILGNAKRFSLSSLLRLVLPLMIGGFLLVSFMSDWGDFPSIVLSAGFSAMEMLLFLMVCAVSYGTGASALWLFGLLCLMQFALRLAGSLAGSALADLGGVGFYTAAAVAVISVVVIAGLVLMSEKDLLSFWRRKPSLDEVKGVTDERYYKARIESLACIYGLTEREKEAFHLLMQGKSNIAIAHDMFISEGTVKAHLHHIYQKLGVHTRKELANLVESEQA